MAELTCLVRGIGGAEGPCLSRDGRLFMVWPGKGRIIEIFPGEEWKELANTGGIPAGLQIDPHNDLWVADMKLGIFRVTLAGEVFHEVSTFNGAPIRGCNDCFFDNAGHLYFTAPAGSNGEQRVGELFCRTNTGEVHKLDEGFAFCNGLAVTADDKTLIVAETYTRELWAYDIVGPGKVANKRLWATLREGGLGPDGMDFDAKGRLLVAYYGGSSVEIFAPDGTHERTLELPTANVTNVHFGGTVGAADNTLYITEASENGLWRTTHDAPGQLPYGFA